MLGLSLTLFVTIFIVIGYFCLSNLSFGKERRAQLALYDLVSYTLAGVALLSFAWQLEARFQTTLTGYDLPDRSILSSRGITDFERSNCKIANPPEYCGSLNTEISRHLNPVAIRGYAFEFRQEPTYPESLKSAVDEYNRSVRLQIEIRAVRSQENRYLLILSILSAAFSIGVVRRYAVWRDTKVVES